MVKGGVLTGWLPASAALFGTVAVVAIAPIAPALAQRELQRGVMQYEQMMALQQQPTTLSSGTLIQLRSDPNFRGDFAAIVNDAATLLEGYTIVRRGGYFPENAGIPREQQLTTAQVAYRVYSLGGRDELVLYRTPRIGTAQYFIRRLQDQPAQPTPSPGRQRLG